MKLIIAISGASGVSLGVKFIKYLPKEIEKFVVFTESAKVVLAKEEKLNILNDSDISASIASGSFRADSMAIIPCSMNTLAKISIGIADNLTTRSASVMIKEKKKLLIAPREMPISSIHIENMLKLSNMGVIISPPMLGYYANIQTLEDMEKFIIGKWYDSLEIEHNLFNRWGIL